jgi:hypothetical protein
LSIARPSKFTQIGIFGMKTNHLATFMYKEEEDEKKLFVH